MNTYSNIKDYQRSKVHGSFERQNAFPSRYYRSTGPTYLSKDVIKHLSSHGTMAQYPNLMKLSSNDVNIQNNYINKEPMKKHVKPKVITVIRGGSERPMNFIRILLNHRSIKSFESLLSDIEESLRDVSKRTTADVRRIFNLFGQEIKTLHDFFKSDDFFIAIGDHDRLDSSQIKEILDHIYPDHPQTDHILQLWDEKKQEAPFDVKPPVEEDSERKILQADNIVYDKFIRTDEGNIQIDNQFSTNLKNTVVRKTNVLTKQKSLKNKIRIKKNATKIKDTITHMSRIKETDTSMNGRNSPTTYKRIFQERNADRLRAAYEDRENARILLKGQLENERRRIENSYGKYSQYAKKLINDNGSITVFKKIDETSHEKRKQRARIQKENDNSTSNFNDLKAHEILQWGDENDKLPRLDTTQTNETNHKVQPEVFYNNLSNNNADNDINTSDHPVPDSMNRKHQKSIKESKNSYLQLLTSQNNPGLIRPNEVNSTVHFQADKLDINDKSGEIEIDNSIIPNATSLKTGDRTVDSKIIMNETVETSVKRPVSNNYDNKNLKEIAEIGTNLNTRPFREKLSSPIPNKILQRQKSVPGKRIFGKLCRQISTSQIFYQRYEITKLLGDGNFAVVKMAVRRDNGREYAIKIIEKSKLLGKEYMIENEIWIMKLCHHENIIRLKEEYESKEEIFLVLELIKGGDLFDAITQNIRFTELVASKMISDLANALFYLHSRQIVHRDLKPENIMVLRHRDGSITLKLADFGLAMEVKGLLYTVCGTATYVSPEMLSEQGYSLEIDLWALGVITYILLSGFPPFQCKNKDQEELFELIQNGSFTYISPYWDKISQDVKDLISKLLTVDRRLRYTTIDVLSDKWIMTKGSTIAVSDESRQLKALDLDKEARQHLESFQRKKNEMRHSINREIQASFQRFKR